MIRVVIENALRVELKLSVESEKAEEERQRPTQRVDGRERESSIDQSAIRLTLHVVRDLESLMSYVEKGTKARKTASTLQNPSSSRSHALLTVDLTREQGSADAERLSDGDSITSSGRQDVTQRAGSRLHLVDLAGSESAATCGGVHRLKEGANINKSLVALGNVISALVERGSTGSGTSKRYIPYRDSSLTWLLKDALGGNATTVMLATISPASGSYNETAHTLRFAQRAQSVVNRPVVNEDPVERLIRELRAEVARLKSLLLQKDIDQQTTGVPCCCGKVQSSKDSTTDSQYREEQESLNTLRSKQSDCKDEFSQSKNDRSLDVFPIRRFNSSDSLTICETGSTRSVRKFNSYEHLQVSDRFINNYNQAKVTELNDEEDEVIDEINEPVFVDIPTLVAVLIKPDDSLQESSTQIEEICSDEVQEDSIDADFIEGGNEEFEETEKIDVDPDDHSISANSCNTLGDSEVGEFHKTPSSPASVGRSGPRGTFSKQNSIDLPSSNLNVSKKFGSIDGINKKKDSSILDHLQRSHTNLDKRPTLSDRGKKLNNIREIDDRKVNAKSGSIWKAIGSDGSKDHLQRKSSNESDKSLKDSNIGKIGGYSIGRKPSLENLKRKTSKDSSSSSSKDEQILISSLTRDKLLRRKNSLDQEAANGVRHHTAIQRVKRADIVAAVTERLYSSRKLTEESNNMATNSVSGTRSPPEGTDVKVSSNLMARSRLQEISRKMLMKRRRINVDTQTETASTLRFRDTASLTDEPKVVLQDAAVLTEEHMDYDVTTVTNHRLPVLRVKDMATLTDRRPHTSIFRCKDAESLANDLDFDDYELHSPRNDSGILSDDTQNYAESNLSSAEMSELYPEADRRIPCTDSSTNTFLASSGRNSAVQTETGNREVPSRQKESLENRGRSHCCGLVHEIGQRVPVNSPERNVISISLPDMISITIESTNGLESRIAVTDGSDAMEEKPQPISSDKESQTEQIKNEAEGSFLKDLTVRSTAIQADGRVFRIENIFQDPKSNNYHDAASDLRKETIKKSMVFRNSLGTSSIIETKENDAKMEWDIQDLYQKKQPILKSDLMRAFVAKKRSYSLNPRRPTNRLACQDLLRNWTFPCSEFIDFNREMIIMSPTGQQDTDTSLIDSLPSSAVISECTSANKILEEPIHESCKQDFVSSFEDLKESAFIKDLLDCDNNFSDDSLDEDNITKRSIVVNTMDTQNLKNYESVCPPDVVAHTKKEASKSAVHKDSINVESSIDDDFDDTEMELPKKKPAEVLDKNPMQDYKTLILGTSSCLVDNDSEEEANITASSQSDNIEKGKKKVSFSNPSSPEEITDIVANRKILAPKQNLVAVKSIIKKMKKPAVAENLDIVQSNVEVDQSLRQKKVESAKSEEVLSASKEDQDSEDSRESLNDEKKFSDHNESDSSVSDEDTQAMSKKKNIFEEYLNEAMIFMRNMNSINEYMSAVNKLESCGKRHRRRGSRRGSKPSTDKGHTEFRECKVNLKDDTDEHLQQDEVVVVESYEKCLKGIERLEACIDKVSKHNLILRDRYGIEVESAGAKSSLACPSIDSEMSNVKDSVIHQCNMSLENDAESCEISLPFLSSIQTDVTKQPTLKEAERRDQIKIDDFDNKNNNIPDDDLERKIFDQLMHAADFSKYQSPRQLRQKRLWKMRDLRSRSPTTYSKLRETFRRDTRGIFNFDEVSAAEDYLDDIRGIESSSRNFRKTKLSDQTENIGSKTSISSEIDLEEFCDRNELPEENDNPFKIEMPIIFETKVEYPDCLIDPAKPIELGHMFNTEEEIARKITQRSKNTLRLESANPRFVGSLNMELKYPGSPRAKFLELLKERRRIVENSRGTNAF
ncbi:Kinesin-like protein KIF16B [Camponotus floridanus]|uniref:Kinesin-like protein KIF16B n=1 Tax=Camponotus floridanus TaxID=104421 RepID=E2AL03_CAMFO|nr:Kinesin-like protein KIF16B [Camponotus floridanus]